MRRVATACLVGSAIEFYDFLIYGTAAALVFPTVFFPHLEPAVATIASMGTFGAAFLSRPVGAAVFGHFGDQLGRKKTLVATLLIMAVSTVTVGLVPSTAAIGVAAPLILVALRLLQGFAVGGHWAGSALLSAEYAPADRRGRYGMFTLLGGGTALVLSSLTFLGVNFTIGEDSPAFMQWGWRLPFLISAGLIVIALYVWLKIDETPVFAEEKARNLVPKAPLAEVLRLQRREIALAGGSVLGSFALRLHGRHLPDQLRPLPPGVFPQRHLVRRCAGRAGEHRVRRALGHSVRSSRAPPDDVGGVGGVSAVVVCGDPAGRYRQPRFVRGGDRGHVRRRRDRLRDLRRPSSPSCSPPATATPDRRWR